MAGLLNFAIPILRPFPDDTPGFLLSWKKLYNFVNFIHHYSMTYNTFVNEIPIYTDALLLGTSYPLIIIKFPFLNVIYLSWKRNSLQFSLPILPGLVITDNMACLHLFRNGRFPPSRRSNYSLTKLMIETFHKPIIMYSNTKLNPADIVSRAIVR